MKEKSGDSFISCASCDVETDERICMNQGGTGSRGCPTLTRREVLEEANREYEDPDIREFARQASIQEAECYANISGQTSQL